MDDNWKHLVENYEGRIGDLYVNERQTATSKDGSVYEFFGLVHSDDDYYFGMCSVKTGVLLLLSCVCPIEMSGFVKMQK